MTEKATPVEDQERAARLAALQDLPLVYEDDLEGDMGQTSLHTRCTDVLHYGIEAHLAARPGCRVFSNLNLHYQPRFPRAYLSPDVMVVEPSGPLPDSLSGFYLEKDGPPPLFVAEVLSKETAEERDLGEKPLLYATMGIAEYLLVDLPGKYLPQRLLLKQLQAGHTWKDEQDADGGVTSRLGFRVVIDTDGHLRIVDAKTGKRYVRPWEAQEAVDRLHALEQELAQQKKQGRKRKGS